jgi:Ni2+-binding GTPase involved in maturation of urease and hydrogenase
MPNSLTRPREIHTAKTVRIVLVGGFLGAGKTTALVALAAHFRGQGLSVAVITNDQAANLVDTAIVQNQAVSTAEVAGGCFCCRFTDLLDAFERVLPHQPDIILCEPVGSCTDMAATVLNPLRLFYRDTFTLAPFTVLVDPTRARQLLLDTEAPFAPEVGYIFEKQLEEADLIAVSKMDTLTVADAEALQTALSLRFGKPVLTISATAGDGIPAWAEPLQGGVNTGASVLPDLDYDRYARGEAVLGWLNATATVSSDRPFPAETLLESVLRDMEGVCAESGAEIAHLKASFTADGDLAARAHITRTGESPNVFATSPASAVTAGILTLNARVEIDPGRLGGAAVSAIQRGAASSGATARIDALQSFSPAYPRPPYRLPAI